MAKNNRNYKEISLNTKEYDTRHTTMMYQYEYALYKAVTGLFEGVDCRSYTEPFGLYFAELPDAKKESVLDEVSKMVARDVAGHVNFPMMHICRAQVSVTPESDGSHTFNFTDGVYEFTVHIAVPVKGHPKGIDVNRRMADKKEAAPECAA